MTGFDINELERMLSALPLSHRVAFAASCCERLLPNYIAFSRIVSWGDPAKLREALDVVWAALEDGKVNSDRVHRLIDECDQIVPDTEVFSSPLVSAALDAATAVVETLKCLLDGSARRAAEVGSFCRDTVDMYIQVRDRLDFNQDPEFEDKIASDPLMTNELHRQARLLSELAGRPELDRAFLEHLRTESMGNGVSNIGLTA